MIDNKVYVVHSDDYLVDRIKREMQEEGYAYSFHFDGNKEVMKDCNELWCFGDCSNNEDVKLAKELGLSVWVMG